MCIVLLVSRNEPSGWPSGRLSAGSVGTVRHASPSSEVDGVPSSGAFLNWTSSTPPRTWTGEPSRSRVAVTW